jgi:hypothetical protein
VPTCGLGPWPDGTNLQPVEGHPGVTRLMSGPNRNCANTANGCNVTVSTTWEDGVTASKSQVLTSEGTYTLNDGRGTTATFSVFGGSCVWNGADFRMVWPVGT